MELDNLIQRLPIELIEKIISFSYKPQPEQLLLDIRSFYFCKRALLKIYKEYHVHYLGEDHTEYDWLYNDLLGFYNDDIPTMYFITNHFQMIFKRNFIRVKYPVNSLDKNNSRYCVNIMLGLMNPYERLTFVTNKQCKLMMKICRYIPTEMYYFI